MAGEEISRLSKNRLAEIRNTRIGFIFQTFNLLPRMTALENVELPLHYAGRRDAKERAIEALKEVGLADRMKHSPTQLSGGQRQRVAVARALVGSPQIVLADEPTANLDSETGARIIDLMKEMNQRNGTTFIFSTHDAKVMSHADAVVRLADGKIVGRELAGTAIAVSGGH